MKISLLKLLCPNSPSFLLPLAFLRKFKVTEAPISLAIPLQQFSQSWATRRLYLLHTVFSQKVHWRGAIRPLRHFSATLVVTRTKNGTALPFTLFAIRETPRGLGCSPFELLFGRQLRGQLKAIKNKLLSNHQQNCHDHTIHHETEGNSTRLVLLLVATLNKPKMS